MVEEDDMAADYYLTYDQWHSNADVILILEASSYRNLSPSWCRPVVFAAETLVRRIGNSGRVCRRADNNLLFCWIYVVVVEISRMLWADVVEETSVSYPYAMLLLTYLLCNSIGRLSLLLTLL